MRISGGTPPYAYVWSNGNPPTKDIVNVTAGTYVVTVTDQNQCTANPHTIIIDQPKPLTLDTIAEETSNVSCYELTDGQISLKRLGGNLGATVFTWSNNVNPA